MHFSHEGVAITGLGMISSLGYDAVTSYASSRAGLTRPKVFDDFQVLDEDSLEMVGITVHSIANGCDGFSGVGRLCWIANNAFEDLTSQMKGQQLDLQKTGLFLSIPNLSRVMDDDELEEIDRAFEKQQLGEAIVKSISVFNKIEFIHSNIQFYDSGHTGVLEALDQANRCIISGEIDHCFIGGVDTLLDKDTLAWLENAKRLKTPENPAGLFPGEAGIFILLEKVETALSRGACIQALVSATAISNEKNTLADNETPATGNGLTDSSTQALKHSNWMRADLLIQDHNGELYRANELSNFLCKLSTTIDTSQLTVWYPSISFGDTHAASGGVSVGMGLRAFARNYAGTAEILIASSSDEHVRASVCLTAY